MDTETYLDSIPDVGIRIYEVCPECKDDLVGVYEASTGAVHSVECVSCNYKE